MRKRITGTISPTNAQATGADWLPLDQIAAVEVSSEESSYPIEDALLDRGKNGWRAAQSGEQTIRLVFDHPRQIKQIRLLFTERDVERAQEFVLRWSPDDGQTFHEIVRQQWNFNPTNSAEELEDYHVDLTGVTQLELKIIPDRSGGEARATLSEMRLA